MGLEKMRSQPEHSSRPLRTVIYTPESRLRHPIELFREMWLGLLESRGLARQLLIRDIKAQYRRSWLGYVWAFVPAIATAIGLTVAKSSNLINVASTDLPYAVYIMLSVTLWQTFSQSILAPISGVNGGKRMLAKIKLPPEALVLARLGQVLFNFCIRLILIAGVFIWFRIPVGWGLLAAPVGLLHIIVLGTALGMFLAPIAALYSDVGRLLGFAMTGWLLITPVVYPSPKAGILARLVEINPVTHLLVTTRELATNMPISNPEGFWIVSGISFVSLIISWIFFRVTMPFIIERMSA